MAACQKVKEQGHMMDSVLDPAILVWQSCINYIFFCHLLYTLAEA